MSVAVQIPPTPGAPATDLPIPPKRRMSNLGIARVRTARAESALRDYLPDASYLDRMQLRWALWLLDVAHDIMSETRIA